MNKMNKEELKSILYKKYLEYLKSTARIDLSRLKRSYESIYFWIKDHLEKDLPPNKNVKILVIGCGLGNEVYALNKMGYKNVLGIDVSKEQIKIAKANGLNCICADAFEFLRNNKGKFDVILASGLIEHFKVEKVFELLKLCYNNLCNTGILILKTPNANNPFALKWIYGDITHEEAFNDVSLTQLLVAVGFSKIKFKNVKPFGRLDNRITIRILKLFLTVIVNLTWGFIKLFYILNGIKPPKVVSPDLLAIAYKEEDKNER